MLEQVFAAPAIYRLVLPDRQGLPPNCYVLRSQGVLVVVDPPVKERAECEELIRSMNELSGEYSNLQIVFTHLHREGFGFLSSCFPPGTVVYLCEQDPLFSKHEDPCNYQKRRFRREGYPKGSMRCSQRTSGEEHGYFRRIPVGEGDTISVGSETLRCLYTPGHTLGHICLLLESSGVLFSGDVVLSEAMPRVGVWRGKISSVEALLGSLERLKEVDPVTVFPGHGDWQGSFQSRIDEMIRQYYFRLLELYQLVNDHPGLTTFELSERFLRCKEGWPTGSEKETWNGMGETLAHLIYLRNCGYVSAVQGSQGIINVPGNRRLIDY